MSVKIRKQLISALSFLLFAVLFFCGVINGLFSGKADQTQSIETYSTSEYEENMTRPFWKSNVIYNEIVMPYNNAGADGTIGYGQLLYKPLKIISVRDPTLNIEYTKGTAATLILPVVSPEQGICM